MENNATAGAHAEVNDPTDALRICEKEFNRGNRTALYDAIEICAKTDSVIPRWAAIEIVEGRRALESGKTKDYNVIFRGSLAQYNRWLHKKKIKENTNKVLTLLMRHRCENGSLNCEEAFGAVAEDTGLPRRMIEEIYRESGKWIKGVPQGNPDGGVRGFSICELPPPKVTEQS